MFARKEDFSIVSWLSQRSVGTYLRVVIFGTLVVSAVLSYSGLIEPPWLLIGSWVAAYLLYRASRLLSQWRREQADLVKGTRAAIQSLARWSAVTTRAQAVEPALMVEADNAVVYKGVTRVGALKRALAWTGAWSVLGLAAVTPIAFLYQLYTAHGTWTAISVAILFALAVVIARMRVMGRKIGSWLLGSVITGIVVLAVFNLNLTPWNLFRVAIEVVGFVLAARFALSCSKLLRELFLGTERNAMYELLRRVRLVRGNLTDGQRRLENPHDLWDELQEDHLNALVAVFEESGSTSQWNQAGGELVLQELQKRRCGDQSAATEDTSQTPDKPAEAEPSTQAAAG